MNNPALALLGLALAACSSVRDEPPPITPSAPELPVATVRVSRGASFSPSCVVINPGDTVEWRNLTPRTAIAALSTTEPYEISAPALLAPYNTLDITGSDECVRHEEDGACAEAIPFSYWRHRFDVPGVFDYRDPSGGASGGSGGTSEYGLPVGPTMTVSAALGTVCVRSPAGAAPKVDCAAVCCISAQPETCGADRVCVNGRCEES